MRYTQWLLVLACVVDMVFSQNRDTSRYLESNKFDNRQPVEHRSDSSESRDKSSEQDGPQVEQPLQNNFGGFRMSYPLHEFGSPFNANFNRLDDNTPDPYYGIPEFKRPFNIPQYDSDNFFKRPNKIFHLRHEYEDKDCKDDEDRPNTSLKGKGTQPREPNFHQRFDPGPDGFGPFGRRPQIIDHTDFFNRPEENIQNVKSTDHRAVIDKEGDNQPNRGYNKRKQDKRIQESQYDTTDDKTSRFTPLVNSNNHDFNRFESSTSNTNEPTQYFRNKNAGVHMRRFKDIPNKEFRHYNEGGLKRGDENDEIRSNLRETQTSNNEDENTSSQDQYSRHRAVAGWHPTRQRH